LSDMPGKKGRGDQMSLLLKAVRRALSYSAKSPVILSKA